jgi:hypothetical protein
MQYWRCAKLQSSKYLVRVQVLSLSYGKQAFFPESIFAVGRAQPSLQSVSGPMDKLEASVNSVNSFTFEEVNFQSLYIE